MSGDDALFADYRKNPVVVQARRMDADFTVMTNSGIAHGRAGDYLIRGINGEEYPCAAEAFTATYTQPARDLLDAAMNQATPDGKNTVCRILPLQEHHDGMGLNDRLVLYGDADPHASTVSYHYVGVLLTLDDDAEEALDIQFQKGAPGAEDSTPGVTVNAVLAVALDHLRAQQAHSGLPSRDTAIAITSIEDAMLRLDRRVRQRKAQGVLNTRKPHTEA